MIEMIVGSIIMLVGVIFGAMLTQTKNSERPNQKTTES